MANKTPRFGFITFDSQADTIALQGYKAFGADSETLDRILTYAIEKHTHDGTTVSSTPPNAPRLWPYPTGGALLPNQALYYRTSTIDARGQERVASVPAVTYTPAQLDTPTAPPTLTRSTGSLLPGDYLYAMSAYSDTPDRETVTSPAVAGSLASAGGFEVSPPFPPSGATGWNIYRKGPTDYELHYLDSMLIDTGAYSDNNTTPASRLRGTPIANTTSTTASVVIDLDTELAAGETCKIYRTYAPGDWEDSLLTWTAVLPYTDRGTATRAGSPPAVDTSVGGAPRIELGVHTIGTPPPAATTPATLVNFTFTGPVEPGYGTWQWVNEYEDVVILTLRATLGRGSMPAAQPVIVALERRSAGTVLWHRFHAEFGLTDITAQIPVGDTIGPISPMPFGSLPSPRLHPGDAIRAAILQTGGGATPTDENLSVVATLAVHGSATQTYTWET
jgi:hypothetical protein